MQNLTARCQQIAVDCNLLSFPQDLPVEQKAGDFGITNPLLFVTPSNWERLVCQYLLLFNLDTNHVVSSFVFLHVPSAQCDREYLILKCECMKQWVMSQRLHQ